MSRKSVFLAALVASTCFAASAAASDAALFSNAGQLKAGKALLAEGGISGVAGGPANDSFAAVKTMKFSGGALFSASSGGTAGALANPDVVAKLTASAQSFSAGGSAGFDGGVPKDSEFSAGGAAGLTGGETKDGAFSGGGAVGLTGSEAKNATFSAGGAAGLTSGESTNSLLKAGLAARTALMSLSK